MSEQKNPKFHTSTAGIPERYKFLEQESLSQLQLLELSNNKFFEKFKSLLKKYNIKFKGVQYNDSIDERVIMNYIRKYKLDVDENFYKELADLLKIDFISNRELVSNFDLATILPYNTIRKNLIFITEITDDYIKVATSNPFSIKIFDELEKIFNRRVKLGIASYDAIEIALDFGYKDEHAYKAMSELRERNPADSAYKVIYPWQKYFIYLVCILLGASAILGNVTIFILLFSLLNIYYFIINPFKIFIATRGFKHSQIGVNITQKEVYDADITSMPVYSVLVPVYKEARVLPEIIKHMNDLYYPKDKLDVQILIEENDDETITAARRLGLIGEPQVVIEGMTLDEYKQYIKFIDVTIVPNADVKTKPRACNYGLYRAKGEYVVIYDAEDEPDRDQLVKAVVAFRKLPKDYVCLQGHLNYFNYYENALARCFAIEYTFWFDFWLQGLDYIGAPLPLGGTSNHFKTEELKKLGGWDPYNVTEDADLGIRIVMKNLKTSMLNSTTLEEANLEVGNWIRQRSRWIKGYVQTFLVHTRHPLRLFKKMGLKQTFYFFFTFGGNIIMPLLNPILWLVTFVSLIDKSLTDYLFTPEITSIAIFNLILGNIIYVILHLIPCIIKKQYSSIPYAFLMPLYWIIMSYAAWKGALQLIYKPFYWEKTNHGLSSIQRQPIFKDINNNDSEKNNIQNKEDDVSPSGSVA